jgi:hypothetical protein
MWNRPGDHAGDRERAVTSAMLLIPFITMVILVMVSLLATTVEQSVGSLGSLIP